MKLLDLQKCQIIRYFYPIWTVLSVWTPLISLKVIHFIDTWRYISVKKSNWKDNLAWKVQKSVLFGILKETCVFRGVLILITGKFKFLLDIVKLLSILKSGELQKADKAYFRMLLYKSLKNVFFVYLFQDLVKLRLIPNINILCPLQM